ncbi:MAG: hypothetical protein K2K83_00585 [Rikenella sp.]|nr:hypothetical protein [Rikenella sp.]
MYDVGLHGYSWSSTIPTNSTDTHHLGFRYNWLDPNVYNARAYGFSLRCLQE